MYSQVDDLRMLIRMNSFRERLDIGEAHEERVAEELTLRGWTVNPWGQGVLTDPVREALRGTDSALRWTPDMIAARGEVVVLIDAKDSMSDTGRFAIARDSVRAHLQFAAWTDAPVYYVLGASMAVLTPHEVLAVGRTGPHLTIGRRGPYYLVASAQARRFDDVFGTHEQVLERWAAA